MGPRPNHLKINSNDLPPPPKSPFHMEVPSPRTGEAPPALSPLDAFAMQSRLLAKKFEEAAENGKRISRLPHTDVARELSSRPGYFRVASNGSEGGMSDVPELKEEHSPISPNKANLVVTPGDEHERPKSQYPMFGNTSRPDFLRSKSTPFFDAVEELPNSESPGYFGLPMQRARSPEPLDRRMINVQAASPLNMPSLTNSVDSIQSTQQQRTPTNGSSRSQRSLAPPRSPAYPKSPRSFQSIRSIPADSGDEDGSNGFSSSRKFSASSGMSRPQSPYSPWMQPMRRSPSITSEFSSNGSQKKTNFSRPLSSSSNRPHLETRPSFDSRSSFETRPSTELPYRQPYAASVSTEPSSGVPSRQASGDDTAVPIPFGGAVGVAEDANDDEFDDRPTTSYTYRKFDLPRGRNVERSSRGTRESWIQRQFTWDHDRATETKPEAEREGEAKTSIEAAPAPEPEQQIEPPDPQEWMRNGVHTFESPPRRVASPAMSERLPQERKGRLLRDRAKSNASRSRSAEPRTVQKAAALHKSTPSVRTHGTDSTDRTIRQMSLHERVPSAELSTEEHLEIGIQSHSAGELSKSTYHLRIAAREGSPTGMLLYALACRHGWGMRPNQEEGVRWLKKAIDTSGLEVADVEETLSAASKSQSDPVVEAQERRKRKAQFALAIYELGISYMNGWGCPKDKPLAIRCYEVAGNWGDCDALAEAAFCYTQGTGCKKDFKKAAALYRKAAEGGMSMAGNSWIYKPKYMDDSSKSPETEQTAVDSSLSSIRDTTDTASTGRARSRSIWRRNKFKPAYA